MKNATLIRVFRRFINRRYARREAARRADLRFDQVRVVPQLVLAAIVRDMRGYSAVGTIFAQSCEVSTCFANIRAR